VRILTSDLKQIMSFAIQTHSANSSAFDSRTVIKNFQQAVLHDEYFVNRIRQAVIFIH
jgi:hypothetical protein